MAKNIPDELLLILNDFHKKAPDLYFSAPSLDMQLYLVVPEVSKSRVQSGLDLLVSQGSVERVLVSTGYSATRSKNIYHRSFYAYRAKIPSESGNLKPNDF